MVRRWFHRKSQHNTKTNINKKKYNIRFFRLDTLQIATNNFSTIIGRGGFGSVYKGVLPDDGRTVAIKRNLRPHDGFLDMADFIFHARHINLIQVIGCCVENGEQILVCEFADNGNILQHLRDEKRPVLSWERRAAVCIGAARGLCYLHEEISQPVIHRDIKPSNILLDANFVPKIADFDLLHIVNVTDGVRARFEYPDLEDTSSYTTTVRGTFGYLDPTFIVRGELTEKVDVYSFGLTVLEIITGRRPVDFDSIETDQMIGNWVKRVKKEGSVLEIVDPNLTDFPKEDAERFINVALLCTRSNSELRPTMFEVVHMLYGRHTSNLDISEMAIEAVADQPEWWSGTDNYPSDFVNADVTDSSSVMETSSAAETQSREESIVPIQNGECSSSNDAPSSSKEEVVREYFEKSMEKIITFHLRNQTTGMKMSSENMFMEAVYPPFLTGEYRRTSRVRFSPRPAPF